METVKETKEFKIFKKKSGRFGVKGSNGKWINGDEKVKILSAEGLIKISVTKKKPEPVEEAAPEAPVEETSSSRASILRMIAVCLSFSFSATSCLDCGCFINAGA